MHRLFEQIEKSFPEIEKLFTETRLLEFSHTSKGDLEKYNFGLGTMIRLKFLRPKSTLYRRFKEYSYSDIDEITMEVIKEFHKYLRGKT